MSKFTIFIVSIFLLSSACSEPPATKPPKLEQKQSKVKIRISKPDSGLYFTHVNIESRDKLMLRFCFDKDTFNKDMIGTFDVEIIQGTERFLMWIRNDDLKVRLAGLFSKKRIPDINLYSGGSPHNGKTEDADDPRFTIVIDGKTELTMKERKVGLSRSGNELLRTPRWKRIWGGVVKNAAGQSIREQEHLSYPMAERLRYHMPRATEVKAADHSVVDKIDFGEE